MQTKVSEEAAVLFTEEVNLTGITEYGIAWSELLAGNVQIPPQGARFDIGFEGTFNGPRVRGTIRGVDYLEVRADGRFNLNIHATLVTDDGETISLQEDGLSVPSPSGTAALRLNMRFSTAAHRYTWLNALLVRGEGELDLLSGRVTVTAIN